MPPSSIHMDHIRTTQQAMRAEQAGTPSPQKADSKEEGMSFWDVLDVVNPLQHIPIVNKIYQAVTGDTIKTPAKLAGSALFFGPIGLAAAAADAVVEKETGKDMADNVTGWLGIGGKGGESAPASPAGEDDPLTVTAPRPQKAAAAGDMPQKVAALPVQELTDGQAAALERLMAASQGTSAPAVNKPAPAQALGGIGNAQQLKDLQSLPGASAAAMAASGLGASAAVASLPTPGAGVGSNAVAALAQQDQQPAAVSSGSAGHHKNGPAQGMTLADYRANAVQTGSMGVKPLIPSTAVQLAQQHGGMPSTHAAMTTQSPVTTSNPAPAAPIEVPAAPAEAPVTADQAAAAAAPPSRERLAELMLMGITKYQQQQQQQAHAAGVAAANSNGTPAARKAGNE
ncbi:hypothetical protein GE253_03085 [Niveispirillum sp. SYP-B3756]|uniref:hypothetical protein n=1 Tax=Niveispirillum sp. SYP-B3756 TaxID=2662178 RepID=UPI001290AA67|nr:hypothetical protein [Niveispirillum sp. SYP-B3756]MQP64321.1 hypothetical protein [Niveispirillum sp. SYP-B3756]